MENGKTAKRSRLRRRLAVPVMVDPENNAALAATLPPAPTVYGFGQGATSYRPEIAAEICQRLALGETLTAICAEPGYPDRSTFNAWVVSRPELREAWIAARRVKATSLFDEALDLARDLKEGRKMVSSNEVNALRVAIDTLRWAASKLDPGQYGETAGKTPAIAIQINSNLDLGATHLDHENDSLYSFTIKLPAPLDASTGAEQQRVPASKRRSRGAGSPAEGESDG